MWGQVFAAICWKADPHEILVVELSSFQLETLRARCLEMAAILNITPNHLDRTCVDGRICAGEVADRGLFKEKGRADYFAASARCVGSGGESF